jgi:hypothetical protein
VRDRPWYIFAIGLIAPVSVAAGIALRKADAIVPNPQTFFGLGVLATISIGGIVYSIAKAWSATDKQSKSFN